jgi:hypothetical protein
VLAGETFDCQVCGAALTGRRKFNIHVLAADLDRLRRLGFAVRRAA